MIPRHLRIVLLLALGAQVLINGIACSDDHDDDSHSHAGASGSGGSAVNVDDLLYEGEVTDEAAESILGVAAQTDSSKAATISAPTEGAALPAATPFAFTWNASTARRTVLPAWLGPERSAHAHGDPFTGVAYLLTFSTASTPALVRVVTDKTTYTPTDAVWSALKGAGGPITLSIIAARIENNLLVNGGGPYTAGKGVSFTIAP